MPTTMKAPPRDTYLELVLAFPLRPIRNEADYQRAMKQMLSVDAANPKPTQAVHDYLEVLIDLIDQYEHKAGLKMDVSHVTPRDIIKHLMEQAGLTVTSLAGELGINQGNLSEMLNGNRSFNKSAMLKLAERFKLNPGLLMKSSAI